MKKYLLFSIFFFAFLCTGVVTISAKTQTKKRDAGRMASTGRFFCIQDDADLLSESEEEILSGNFTGLVSAYGVEIQIITIEKKNYRTMNIAVEKEIKKRNIGNMYNGNYIVLLLSEKDQQGIIYRRGKKLQDVDLKYINEINAEMKSYLFHKDFYGAIYSFYNKLDYALSGQYVPEKKKYNEMSDFTLRITLTIFIGVLFAWLGATQLKRQLQSVYFQKDAGNYFKKNGLELQLSEDIFLYSTRGNDK